MTAHPATQAWVHELSIMQQSVLLSAIRGCDGLPKRHKAKNLVKWYRRCVLVSAFDGRVLGDPFEPGGGSFTGPVAELPTTAFMLHDEYHVREDWQNLAVQLLWKREQLQRVADNFVDSRDELPMHYQLHFMHAVEILGYKHPNNETRIFWLELYERLAHAYHLWPETEVQLDSRLGDTFEGWAERNDPSACCSD